MHTGIKSMSVGGSTEILANDLLPKAVGLGLLMLTASGAAAGLVLVDSIWTPVFVGAERLSCGGRATPDWMGLANTVGS